MPATLHDFSVRTADGGQRSLGAYRGQVVLVVNTASRCGFTHQYASLETLRTRYHERGFEVLAFPANDFLGQEPGADAEVQEFCRTRFGVSFPVLAKIHVRGRGMDPLYTWLTTASGFDGPIPWNFTKFLVGRDGRVVARFPPPLDPLDDQVTQAIETQLGAR